MGKILIVLRILWTAGAQRIAINEYKWLKKLGHEPKIVFLRATKTKGYEELLKDVKFRVIRYGNGVLTPLFYLPTKLFSPDRGIESTIDLDLILKIPKIAKEEEADYMICHDQFAGIGCYQTYKKMGIPYSVFIHEKVINYSKPVLGNIMNDIERKVLSNARRVFAVTDKVAKTVYEKHKINAIPNYPGMDKISERSFSEKENFLITVSFWDYGRRPWDYLEVIKHIEGYKLLMVGNWRIEKAKKDIIKKVKEEKLDERVKLMEGVSENELSELYDKSRFLIRFGYGEYGPAMTVIESIQHTTPVIINDELGTAELVSKYNLGLVTHGLDYDTIRNFISKIDEEDYKKLQNNINRVQKEYSWESHTRKLINDY
ncbi:glycosyltransferase family 4 protein [Saccharolobus islandicus]|uniref:glycosyltransferase family 4 protein n=1 Tax=Saccharolobus islandicus TaxID=43080 RepID=UPI000370443E|nr:glycosyltransferase family 4 protein [Sulfolobus islandicus]